MCVIIIIGTRNQSIDFHKLNTFLDHLRTNHLAPVIELMAISFPLTWSDLVSKFLAQYTNRYPSTYMAKWRFETWNEPDLKQYNINNITLTGTKAPNE